MEERKITKQDSLLLLEANMVNTVLLEGLDCLRKASNFELGLYYQAFFSLSTGIERILKLIFIYDYRMKNKMEFPQNKELKAKGHRINVMVESYAPQLLETNIYKVVLEFLTDFAKTTRYYNLDTLTGKEDIAEPIKVWNIIEGLLLKEYNAKVPVIQNKQLLENMLNEIMYVHMVGSDGTIINNIEPILFEMETKDIIQGYNVLVFYEIIQKLVNILIEHQKDNSYPDMREIFTAFRVYHKKSEIRNKKNWRRGIG